MPNAKFKELHFPVGGLFQRVAFQKQSPYYTVDSQNVIPDDTISERERGGSRPGLTKSYSEELGSGNLVGLLAEVSYISGGSRVTQLCAASNGIFYRDASGTMTALAGATLASTYYPITAADHLQKLYIANDSSGNLLVYTPTGPTLATVTASAGTVPTSCKIVRRWRDRIILAEDAASPHLWYMSKMGDPTNWDYTETGFDRAVSASVTRAGALGEPCLAVIPHNDDCCIFGMTKMFGVMRGDPAYGGNIDVLSDEVGVHGRASYCYDTDSVLWVWTQDGLYRMDAPCGGPLYSVSREFLPTELVNVNRASYTITMAYDFRFRGIHVCVSDNSSTDNTAYFVDTHLYGKTGQVGFWKQVYQNTHMPFSMLARRESTSAQSLVMWGCRDGYIRNWSTAVAQDDGGNDIASYVYIGPLGGDYFNYLMEQLVVSSDTSSGDIDWEVYAGLNVQAAYDSTKPRASGSYNRAGAQYTAYPRASGSALFVKLINGESNSAWAFESGLVLLRQLGRRRP